MIIKHSLMRGKALVITGPQGCGKTTLARHIAKQYGLFVETDANQLETHCGLNDVMSIEPSTVICDGIPDSEETRARLKMMISDDTVMVGQKHGAPKMVKTPAFIFCTGDDNPLQLVSEGRRFHVVSLGTPGIGVFRARSHEDAK